MRYEFIQDHHAVWPVAIQCRVLAVSRSGYYAWLRRPVCESAKRRDQLISQIQAIHATRYHDVTERQSAFVVGASLGAFLIERWDTRR